MGDPILDDLDRQILHELQLDARNNRDADIANETGVTGTTVANRIRQLETQNVIEGYHPTINYENAGYPLVVLFICTIPLAKRSSVLDETLQIRGVINVRETMSSEQNVHVLVVAESTRAVESVTTQLDEIGLRIVRSDILAKETAQPWNHFYRDAVATDEPDEPTAGEPTADEPDEE